MSFVGQVRHVFGKDLLRFWPALLGLAALVAAHRAFGLPLPERYGVVLPGPVSVFSLLFAALAAAVIQDDPIDSERGLWQTTPLSRMAVLCAKALFIALLLGAVPVGVHVQWILALADGGTAGPLIADAALYQGALLALAALGAAVTPNLGTFLVAAVGTWVGMTLVGSLAAVEPMGAGFSSSEIRATRDYLMRLAWLGIGGALLVHQYSTRRTWRTVAVGAAALALATLGVHRSTLNWAAHPWEPAERFEHGQADRLDFRLTNLHAAFESRALRGAPRTYVMGTLVPELPGLGLVPTGSRARFASPDGERSFAFGPASYGAFGGLPVMWLGVVGMEGAGALRSRGERPAPVQVLVAEGDPEAMEDLRSSTRIDLDVSFDVFEARPLAFLPLERGATIRTGGGALTVEATLREPKALSVELHRYGAVGAIAATSDVSFALDNLSVLLYNRARNEYLFGSGGGGGRSTWYEPRGPRHHLVGGPRFVERPLAFSFNASSAERGGQVLPQDWFDDVEIVFVERAYVGSLATSVTRDIPEWPAQGNRPVEIDPAPRPGGGP